ncbi:unnamed protein product [Diatraea saccharalis]|uniref:Dolichyl-diphosphooligosaccharide--protein glycosyltransferase subunit 2 n=1 Tax=Diatraea saccharalis TaxID=40085 RepID=A0A9N9WLW4_9NEOP|nr:unnamed protein product [Diatraea saccharalis]
MFVKELSLFVVFLIGITKGNILQGTIDTSRLQSILQDGVKSKDISTLYFAIKGLKDLKLPVPDVCEDIKNAKYDSNNIEQVFYLTNAAALSGCQNYLSPEILRPPAQVIDKKDVTIPELYYATYSLKALGKGTVYNKEDGLKNLVQLLKKDDSPINYGYVFGLCEHMGCTSFTTSHAEGVLQAADETDSRALSFDGGLPATSLVLSTILRSYKSQKKPSPLSEEQRYKFAEYLVSRRSVSTPRGAALLLDAAIPLADDQPSPISIVFKGKKYVTSDSDSVEFSITDLLGRPLRNLKPDEVVAQSGTRLADDVVVLSKQALTQKPNEPTTYVLNLSKIKAQYGLYKIALSAGSKTTNVNVAVLGEIQVASVEVGVGDVDGTTSPRLTNVAYPGKLSEKLQADHMQKVTLKFSVRDKYDKPVSVAQAFVRVGTANNEAIFVAEHDNTKAYKVDLNVGAIAKHLNHISGAYSVEIYLGDSAVSNPISWHLGEIMFNFGKDANAVGAVERGQVSGTGGRGPLPEIRHVFRSPEPRPPRLVSDVFAAACAAPLLLLLVLWARLNINFSLFPFSLSALLFHLSLGGSLVLYGVVWLQLTMFEAVRYLLPLALLTFLSGHRLLRRLVQTKTQSR